MRLRATSENRFSTELGQCTPNNTTITHRVVNEDDTFGRNISVGYQSAEGNAGLRAKITAGLVTALTTEGFISISTRQGDGSMDEALYIDNTQVATFRKAVVVSDGQRVEVLTLGNAVQTLRSPATNDDPSEVVYQNRVATTNATLTTLHTFTIPASTTVQIKAYVVARRTGGAAGTAEDGASYEILATYKNVAGTATLIGAATITAAEDQAAWDAQLNVSSGTVLLQIQGAADNNVTWHMTARVYAVGS